MLVFLGSGNSTATCLISVQIWSDSTSARILQDEITLRDELFVRLLPDEFLSSSILEMTGGGNVGLVEVSGIRTN